jgi:hypothetical protein
MGDANKSETLLCIAAFKTMGSNEWLLCLAATSSASLVQVCVTGKMLAFEWFRALSK